MSHSPAAEPPVHVLIVDDSEDAAVSLAMLLELEDISSRSVSDAAAALELVQRITPAVLLIDIGLPDMDGYELARRLRTLPQLRGSTLIALTGRDGQNATETALFDQFWTKPFDPKRLLQQIKAFITQDGGARANG